VSAIRLVVDKKILTRHLESYDESNDLLAIRGDVLMEYVATEAVTMTYQQSDTLAKLLAAGLSLELVEDGSLRVLEPVGT
jgi:hypothetical protein